MSYSSAIMVLALTSLRPSVDYNFTDFPVRTTSSRAEPKLNKPEFRYFRTRLKNGMSQGVNFAGAFTIILSGCGAGCVLGWAVDRRTGQVYHLPLSGEEYPILRFESYPNSRLLKAEWEDNREGTYGDKCFRKYFIWSGKVFKSHGALAKVKCSLENL